MTLPLEINQPEAWTDDKLIHRRCSDLLHGFRRSRDSGFPRRLPTSRASPAYDLMTACHTHVRTYTSTTTLGFVVAQVLIYRFPRRSIGAD